jgi:hypothetical protein
MCLDRCKHTTVRPRRLAGSAEGEPPRQRERGVGGTRRLAEATARLLMRLAIPLGSEHLGAEVVAAGIALLIAKSAALAHVFVAVADA